MSMVRIHLDPPVSTGGSTTTVLIDWISVELISEVLVNPQLVLLSGVTLDAPQSFEAAE